MLNYPPALLQTAVTFGCYFLIVLAIGFAAYYSTRDYSDYVLAGRGLSGVVTAMGVGASDMSGWLMMGLPGAVYVSGISQLWMPIGLMLGAYVNWKFIATRLRVYTEIANDSMTIPAYFENRFEDTAKTLRIVSAIVILVFFIFYSAAGLVGGARVFSLAFNFDYHTALFISAPVIIIYAAMGGFIAVNWVDLFQGFLMLFALLLLPAIALWHVNGFMPLIAQVKALSPHYLHFTHETSYAKIFSLLGWGLGYFGALHLLVRFMAAKNAQVIVKARRICLTWMMLAIIGAVGVGFIGISFYQNPPLKSPENVFLHLTKTLVNPWLAGALLAAVLSAIISTVAAQLLAASTAIAEDFYHVFICKSASSKHLVWVSRGTVLFVAICALLLALDPTSRILDFVSYAWAGLGSSFGPVILISLYWKKMNKTGALCGIVSGGLMVFVWHVAKLHVTAIADIYEIIPSFTVGFLACIFGSHLGPPATASMQRLFAQFEAKLKGA